MLRSAGQNRSSSESVSLASCCVPPMASSAPHITALITARCRLRSAPTSTLVAERILCAVVAACLALSAPVTCQTINCICSAGTKRCVNGIFTEATVCYLGRENGQNLLGGIWKKDAVSASRGCLRWMVCCKDKNFCNANLTLPTTAPVSALSRPNAKGGSKNISIIVAISTGIMFFILCIVFAFFVIRHARNRQQESASPVLEESFHELCSRTVLKEVTISGERVGGLNCRTLPKEVSFVEKLSEGTFGQTLHGQWRGRQVFVKVFQPSKKDFFHWELDIYQLCMLYHENIVELLTADICQLNSEEQRWRITAYHPLGSLADFVEHTHSKYDRQIACRLGLSLAWGLVHLHRPIDGAERCHHASQSVAPKGAAAMGNKPAVAHTALTSRSIMVKDNLTCCIGDFGRAILYEEDEDEVQFRGEHVTKTDWYSLAISKQKGRLIYAAPELLENNLCLNRIEIFRQLDMYAYALILWQVAWSCKSADGDSPVQQFQLPFADFVGSDVTLDKMKCVVCVEMKRPPIPDHWRRVKELAVLEEVITTCWKKNPNSRYTSSYVHKRLEQLPVQ